jgi:hypothetical protein
MRTLFCQLSVLAVVLSQSLNSSLPYKLTWRRNSRRLSLYNAASSESNRGLQHTSMEIEICSHPYQPHSQGFPKKRFGQAKPEYRSFKVSWFDNRNWEARVRAYCRNVYALGQLTMHRNRELKQHLLQRGLITGKM